MKPTFGRKKLLKNMKSCPQYRLGDRTSGLINTVSLNLHRHALPFEITIAVKCNKINCFMLAHIFTQEWAHFQTTAEYSKYY
jgi:hypothetical protein